MNLPLTDLSDIPATFLIHCLLNRFTSNYIIWLFHLLRTCQSTH
nr:MAG TPA: hypothetical protein [Caudoviricetes sp.]DAZ73965.1 MAG TPA: hypothetical protein [Caudoviricetes sp.]